MGYRSDVRCLIYGPPDKIQALWTKHTLSGNEALKFGGLLECIERYLIQEDISVIDLEMDDVKWYEDFPDVVGWNRILQDIDEELPNTEGLTYEFIRIGEDDTDTETTTSMDAERFMYVSRTIEVSF